MIAQPEPLAIKILAGILLFCITLAVYIITKRIKNSEVKIPEK